MGFYGSNWFSGGWFASNWFQGIDVPIPDAPSGGGGGFPILGAQCFDEDYKRRPQNCFEAAEEEELVLCLLV